MITTFNYIIINYDKFIIKERNNIDEGYYLKVYCICYYLYVFSFEYIGLELV